MDPEEKEWLMPKDVAKRIGISLSEVYTLMRQYPPPWPFYRVTATKRLTRSADLDAWLEKVKVPAIVPDKSQKGGKQ